MKVSNIFSSEDIKKHRKKVFYIFPLKAPVKTKRKNKNTRNNFNIKTEKRYGKHEASERKILKQKRTLQRRSFYTLSHIMSTLRRRNVKQEQTHEKQKERRWGNLWRKTFSILYYYEENLKSSQNEGVGESSHRLHYNISVYWFFASF